MNNMTTFKNVMIKSIKSKGLTRENYETAIATWLIKGWLTDDEATECMTELNKAYPVTVTQETVTETE